MKKNVEEAVNAAINNLQKYRGLTDTVKKRLDIATGEPETFDLPLYEPTPEDLAAIDKKQRMISEYCSKSQEDLDDIFNLGIFNEVSKGYLILALQSLGKDRTEIKEAVKAMSDSFDVCLAADARNAYQKL